MFTNANNSDTKTPSNDDTHDYSGAAFGMLVEAGNKRKCYC